MSDIAVQMLSSAASDRGSVFINCSYRARACTLLGAPLARNAASPGCDALSAVHDALVKSNVDLFGISMRSTRAGGPLPITTGANPVRMYLSAAMDTA